MAFTMEDEMSNIREDVAELKQLLETAKRAKVQSALCVELRRLETKLATMIDQQAKDGRDISEEKTVASAPARVYDVPYKNYSWDQSSKYVKFYLTNLKNVHELNVEEGFVKEFTQRSAYVKVGELDGKNHIFEIKQLAQDILPEKSEIKVKTDMVVVMLAKAAEGKNWSHATAAEKAKADKKTASLAPDKGADASSDPSKGIMDMMKKMYDDGDDEMKRTIAKAWTESRDKQGSKMPGMDF